MKVYNMEATREDLEREIETLETEIAEYQKDALAHEAYAEEIRSIIIGIWGIPSIGTATLVCPALTIALTDLADATARLRDTICRSASRTTKREPEESRRAHLLPSPGCTPTGRR